MPLNLLEGTQRRAWGGGCNDIPYQFVAAPLFYHIIWRCCEKCFQCGYTREEVLDLVSGGEDFLQAGSSKEIVSRGSKANLVIGVDSGDGH